MIHIYRVTWRPPNWQLSWFTHRLPRNGQRPSTTTPPPRRRANSKAQTEIINFNHLMADSGQRWAAVATCGNYYVQLEVNWFRWIIPLDFCVLYDKLGQYSLTRIYLPVQGWYHIIRKRHRFNCSNSAELSYLGSFVLFRCFIEGNCEFNLDVI